jgi:hypothetical protein
MNKSSSNTRRKSHLDNNPEWEPITEVESLQKDMLDVPQRSSVAPISYVGLEYCGANRCGRVGRKGARSPRLSETISHSQHQ